MGRLGQGGMGRVYLARSPGGRPAAVKVINDHLQNDERVLSRFRREVETLGTVRSAYTATLIDAEVTTSPYWLATEYVPGPTLHTAVTATGPFPADLCRVLLAALAEGLVDIHVHGVWHRDIKPHNVILSATGPQLIDFGIARSLDSPNLTQVGTSVGSPGYMAPETLTHGESEAAADVFALGATLAFAATGRPPYGDGPAAAVSYRSVHEDVDLSGVDPDLARLISACTHRDPARRPDPQRIVEMCASQTDLVHHPVYQRALASGAAGAAAPGTTAADGAATRNEHPAHPATVVATRVDPAPDSDADTQQTPMTGFGAASGVLPPQPAPVVATRRGRSLPLVLAGSAVVAVVVVATTVFALRGDGSGSHSSTPGKPSAAAARPGSAAARTGSSKTPAGTASSTPPGTSAGAGDGAPLPDTLTVGARRSLAAGEFLQTRRAKLIMQSDGNLVVYDEDGKARWASRTSGTGLQAVFQEDGNLVVYDGDAKPVWASRTSGHPGAVLSLLNDGNVVIRQGGEVVWQTGTAH
ncbi:protein kinase [Streptomyces sp. TG1A-8]|uniref:protein kinase domain-containing protein n=1 Tax=Streptomyces sp. TG1A-8 TaxID=3051385 RepID=UPI00265B8709|nr:protein kinase [Streptomyces sp. TG1A-8]MDO0925309.1 protein kinase [Streptomyces sp. TG1A-8]